MFWMLFTEPRRGFRCENADADTKTSLKRGHHKYTVFKVQIVIHFKILL